MNDPVRQAREFAIAAHGDQRYGAHPYVHHLDAVAAILEPFGTTAQIVGYLHDTIEDTGITRERIETLFGVHVAACVAILTDEPGPDRKARKAATYAKMATVGAEFELALIAKVADRLANVRACVDDGNRAMLDKYRGEHAAFRPAAYRAGLCDALWIELDGLLAIGA
jgi:(p)ppGpp synthase/HD superfamily hydrolase